MSVTVDISKRLVLINSASSMAALAINASILIWLQQYLLGRISPEEYELYPVLVSVMAFLPLLPSVLTAGLMRYIVEAYARGDERRVTQIVSTMLPLTAGVAVFILAAGGVFSWYVDSVLTIDPSRVMEARFMMGLMISSFAISMGLSPFSPGFDVRQRLILFNGLRLGREALRLGLLFALLFLAGTRVMWVVVASVSADMVLLAATTIISRHLVPAIRFRFDEIRWGLARELTSFGSWNLLGSIADMIRRSSDVIILNKFATAVDVNSFYVGAMIPNETQGVLGMIKNPVMPALTSMHAQGSVDRLQSAYLRGGRYGLWVSLLIAVPLVVFSQEVIHLYVGDRYMAAAAVMALVFSVYPVFYGHTMFPNVAVAKAEVKSLTVRAIIIQIVKLLLTLYLVGALEMGAMGSALATFISMTILWPLLNWRCALRMVSLGFGRWMRETMWPGLLPAIVAGVVLLALKFTIQPSTWLGLGLCAGTGMLVYVAVALAFCLQPADREDLQPVLARIARMFRAKPSPGEGDK